MTEEIMIAGPDGRDTVYSAIIIACAGIVEYGFGEFLPPTGRGLIKCALRSTVVISNRPIISSIVVNPNILIALNEDSFARYQCMVRSGGILFYNSTPDTTHTYRNDINLVPVEATDIAKSIGQIQLAYIVMLGALAGKTGLVRLETLKKAYRYKHKKLGDQQFYLADGALENGYRLFSMKNENAFSKLDGERSEISSPNRSRLKGEG